MNTRECAEFDFWTRFNKAFLKTDEKVYADLIQLLRQHAQKYFDAFQMCWIYGVEVEFEKIVAPEDIRAVCQDIWDHPDKYSEYPAKSEAAYYEFLKYLWVVFPNETEKQLVDIVTI